MKPETVNKILSIVQSNYEEIAPEFDLTRKNLTWPFLHKYCLDISQNEKILDVACGNGRLCQELVGKNIDYLGIDSSQALIELAHKNFSKFNFLRANFLDDNFLESCNKGDVSFDKIFFLAALQHVPSQKLRVQALKNIKKYLKPGGTVVMSNWNLWQSRHRNKIIKSAWAKIIGKNDLDFGDIFFPWQGQAVKSNRYYHAFSRRELISLAKQANFIDINFFKDKHNYWLILK
jgi:2-polyprenyl-3-methyl-5-hydroxy-6-metoxy-1,4-benzoquinol methylase